MKKKLPQFSSFLNPNKVFAKLLEKLPPRETPSRGEFLKGLKDRRLLLALVFLVGAALFLLKGVLVQPTEPETQPPPPPPPQQTVTEPPTIAASPSPLTLPSSPASPPQDASPPRPPMPQNQMSEPAQQEKPEPASPPKVERSEAPKVPRDPFFYPQKAEERSSRTLSSSPSSLSPSSLPPPPLPNPPSLERLPSPPSSLTPPPPPGQSGLPRTQKAPPPPQPRVVGVAFGEKALAVLSFPEEGEVPLFVGEVYKGWKVIGIERRPNVVLIKVKTPNGKEILLKHY